MLDGELVIDAHVHAPRLSTVKQPWLDWADQFSGERSWRAAYGEDDAADPELFDALLEREGVDAVLLFSEHSPRATGIQPMEDSLPLAEHNPRRFRLVANVNPHLHYPIAAEVRRQLDLGAVALKLHPVHGAFHPGDKELYPAYETCRDRGVPVIFHSGTSTFPGSRTRYGDPELLMDVIEDFPDLQFIFAHGGRGWWYNAAAFLATARDNVWLDLAGLPPKKLPEYYARFDIRRLARKWVFGTDWPGVPGTARNVQALRNLDLPEGAVRDILSTNAMALFPGLKDLSPAN